MKDIDKMSERELRQECRELRYKLTREYERGFQAGQKAENAGVVRLLDDSHRMPKLFIRRAIP